MNKREYVYSAREVVEIQQRLRALLAALRLPGFEQFEVPLSHAEHQGRYLPPDREEEERAPRDLGKCQFCSGPLIQGKYRPYCHPCWLATKRDGR